MTSFPDCNCDIPNRYYDNGLGDAVECTLCLIGSFIDETKTPDICTLCSAVCEDCRGTKDNCVECKTDDNGNPTGRLIKASSAECECDTSSGFYEEDP